MVDSTQPTPSLPPQAPLLVPENTLVDTEQAHSLGSGKQLCRCKGRADLSLAKLHESLRRTGLGYPKEGPFMVSSFLSKLNAQDTWLVFKTP